VVLLFLLHHTETYSKGLSIKDVRCQGEGAFQCENFADKEGCQCGYFADKVEGQSIFRDFVPMSFMDGP